MRLFATILLLLTSLPVLGQHQLAFTLDDLALLANASGAGATPPISAPTNLAGVFLWHRSDLGVWSDEGSTAVTVGNPVYRWDDLSGNGNHSRQGDTVAQPLLAANSAGTNRGIAMDGAGDCLTNIYSGTFAMTIFIVASNVSGLGIYPFMLEAGSKLDGEDLDGYWRFDGTLPVWGFAYGGTLYEASYPHPETPNAWSWTSTDDDGANFFTLAYDGSTMPVAYKGENLVITNSPFVSTNYPTAPFNNEMVRRMTIGGYFHGQLTPSDSSAWSELIIYNRKLTDTERQQVWVYIKNRYGF